MDSETKTPGRTDEEEVPSVLRHIQEKLRPLILRKWWGTRANVVAQAMEDGMQDPTDKALLKRALKAFRKRLKLVRLDDESSNTRGVFSGGKVSGIVAISPPRQFPQKGMGRSATFCQSYQPALAKLPQFISQHRQGQPRSQHPPLQRRPFRGG